MGSIIQEQDAEFETEDHEIIEDTTQKDQNDYLLVKYRSRRTITKPARYGYAYVVSFALTIAEEIEGDEPMSYDEVVNSNQSEN